MEGGVCPASIFYFRPRIFSHAAVEFYAVLVFHAAAAENVQRRADGQVNFPAAEPRDFLQVRQRIRAAGVSRRDRRPAAEFFDQFAVNAAAQTFHVHGVDQKFRAKAGEFLQRFRVHCQFGEFLPAVGDDKIFFAALAAAQVEHELFLADGFDEFVQPRPIHAAFAENPARDDDVRRAGVQPAARILSVDAAADVQSAGKRRQRRARLGFVAGAEHDDVAAGQSVAPVKFRRTTRRISRRQNWCASRRRRACRRRFASLCLHAGQCTDETCGQAKCAKRKFGKLKNLTAARKSGKLVRVVREKVVRSKFAQCRVFRFSPCSAVSSFPPKRKPYGLEARPRRRRVSQRRDARNRAGHFRQLVRRCRVHKSALHQFRRLHVRSRHGPALRLGTRRPRLDVSKFPRRDGKETRPRHQQPMPGLGRFRLARHRVSSGLRDEPFHFRLLHLGQARHCGRRRLHAPGPDSARHLSRPASNATRWTRTAWPFPARRRCSWTRPTRPSGTTAAECFFIR